MSGEERLRTARDELRTALDGAFRPIVSDGVEEAVLAFERLRAVPMPTQDGSGLQLGLPEAKRHPDFRLVLAVVREFWGAVMREGIRPQEPRWEEAFVDSLVVDPARQRAAERLNIHPLSVGHPVFWLAAGRSFRLLHAIGQLEAVLKERLEVEDHPSERRELEDQIGFLGAFAVFVEAKAPIGRILLDPELQFRLAATSDWLRERGFRKVARRLDRLWEMEGAYLSPFDALRPRTSGEKRTVPLDPKPADDEEKAFTLLHEIPAPGLSPLDQLVHQEDVEVAEAYLLEHVDRHWRATKAYLRGEHPSRAAAAEAFGSPPDRIRERERKLRKFVRRLLNDQVS
jgi:hypothetical protein